MIDIKSELGPDCQEIVADLLKSGDYASEAQVLRDALKLLAERSKAYDQKLARLHAEIDAADASGPAEPFDFDDFIEQMHAKHS